MRLANALRDEGLRNSSALVVKLITSLVRCSVLLRHSRSRAHSERVATLYSLSELRCAAWPKAKSPGAHWRGPGLRKSLCSIGMATLLSQT